MALRSGIDEGGVALLQRLHCAHGERTEDREKENVGSGQWTQLGLSNEMLVSPPDVLFVPSHVLPLVTPTRSVVARPH